VVAELAHLRHLVEEREGQELERRRGEERWCSGHGDRWRRPEVEDGPDRWAQPFSERVREGEDGVGRRELLGRGRVSGSEKNEKEKEREEGRWAGC
jgi:hypothetical protein